MISLIFENPQTHFCRFYIDNDSEIANLPTHSHGGRGNEYKNTCCQFGSIAECLSGKTYRLSGEDEWVVYKGSSSSSGGNTPSGGNDDNVEPISNDEIDSLFKTNGGI